MAVALTQTGGADAARRYFGIAPSRELQASGAPSRGLGAPRSGGLRSSGRCLSCRTRGCACGFGRPRRAARDRGHLPEPRARAGQGADRAARARRSLRSELRVGERESNAARQRAGCPRVRAAPERAVQPLAGAGQQGQEGQDKVRRRREPLRSLHGRVLEERQRAGGRSAVRRGALRRGRILQGRHRVFARGVLVHDRSQTVGAGRSGCNRRLRLGDRAHEGRPRRAGFVVRRRRSLRGRVPDHRCGAPRPHREGEARVRGAAMGRDGRDVQDVRRQLSNRSRTRQRRRS